MIDFVATQAAIARFVAAATGLPSTQIYWAGQSAQKLPEPMISMLLRRTDELGQPSHAVEDNPLVLSPLTVTAVSTSLDTLSLPAASLVTSDGPVQFTTSGALPAPLQVLTDYWVVKVDGGTIKVASSFAHTGPGGTTVTPIDLTTAGTGTTILHSTADTRRAGQEINQVARQVYKCRLELTCATSTSVTMDAALAVLNRISARRGLPSVRAILTDANVGLNCCEHARAVRGTTGNVLFEPRAIMEVLLNLTSEERETGTIITSASLVGAGDLPDVPNILIP